jgi:hypothetical protein
VILAFLQSSTVLAARSSVGHSLSARPAASVSLASPLVVHHCDQDGHVEAFCYRKRKA